MTTPTTKESPFADLADPPDEEVSDSDSLSETDTKEAPGAPESDDPPTPGATTMIVFPMPEAGSDGRRRAVSVTDLANPAQRVAELVEALQEVLVAPPVVAQLEQLVFEAECLEVTDAASFTRCTELYEQLHANEKGIELTIGPVVGFFHRPWQAMTKFRARFANPVAAAKKRLSDVGGAWQLAERRRAEDERRKKEQQARTDEQDRLRKLAEVAKQNGDERAAAVATQMVEEVTAPALPTLSLVPSTPTKGRKQFVVDTIDEDLVYKGMADGTIPRCGAPLDLGYFNRQAKDLGEDMPKRFPGVTVKEKGGLTASGK